MSRKKDWRRLSLAALAFVALTMALGWSVTSVTAQEEPHTPCADAGGTWTGAIGPETGNEWTELGPEGELSTADHPLCVYPPETGSITIVKDTDPEDNDGTEFDFDGDLGDFDIEDDESFVAADLVPGVYRVQERETDGYELSDISCAGGSVDIDDEDREVTVTLEADDAVVCTFTNDAVEPDPEPTTAPTSTPEPAATPVVIVVPGPTQIVEVVKEVPITPPNTGSAGIR